MPMVPLQHSLGILVRPLLFLSRDITSLSMELLLKVTHNKVLPLRKDIPRELHPHKAILVHLLRDILNKVLPLRGTQDTPSSHSGDRQKGLII